jgi:hypothetical protein
MTEYPLGLKIITEGNWLQKDEALKGFVRFTPNGPVEICQEEWLNLCLEPNISNKLPIEIQRLYQVAKSTMSYGYFFYPLFTLGLEQILRVAESAIEVKCIELGFPKTRDEFMKKIEFLIEKGVIKENEKDRWKGLHIIRNESSHPSDQSIFHPLEAITIVKNISNEINKLFM